MLDVHPPHHAATTWRDFFIHIATIVIGLLIAVGLEQTVEAIHHHHQVAEMEEALRQESLENRHVIQDDIAVIDAIAPVARADMASLEPGRFSGGNRPVVLTPLPGAPLYAPIDAAWLGMRDSALIAIVPRQLSANYWKLDFIIHKVIDIIEEAGKLKDRMIAIVNLQTPASPLSPSERDALRMAFSELNQQLDHLRVTLSKLDVSLDLALQGKDLSIEASNDAMKQRYAK